MFTPAGSVLMTMSDHSIPGKIGFGVLGFAYAIAAYRIPTLGVAYVITTIGAADLIKASLLIQFAVGALISVVAYVLVSNRPLKSGMRVCYGLIMGALFAVGGYTILTSL